MRWSVSHEPHEWVLPRQGGGAHSYQCDGTAVSQPMEGDYTPLKEPPAYEIPHDRQLRAQAVHTIFTALGGLQVFGFEGSPGIVQDDVDSVRMTQRWMEPGGKRYLYTTNVTVSVSRVELT